MAIAKIQAFLGEQECAQEDLQDDVMHMWERLDQEKQQQHKAHYQIFLDGDGVRKAFDRKLYDELMESEAGDRECGEGASQRRGAGGGAT